METSTPPLIAIGTFGVHLLKNPAGTFSFFGESTKEMSEVRFNDYESGFDWLASYIRGMDDKDQQRELSIASTPELFARIINSLN